MHRHKLCVALCAASLSTPVIAQTTTRPGPAEAVRPAPMVEYQSVFSGYQPFREQKGNVWKEVNKEVADNPGMGSMGSTKDKPGTSMSGMSDKGHNGMAGMGGMGDKGGVARKGGKGSMAGMAGHGAMAMAKPQASAAAAKATETRAGPVNGSGVILQIDKANAKVKMTHEPIDALGWPRMTMFFRLKDSALADRVKVGDKITFSLEKAGSGYVISGFAEPAGAKDTGKSMGHDMTKGEKK